MRTAVLVALVGLVCVVSAARLGPGPAPAPAPGKLVILGIQSSDPYHRGLPQL